MLRRLLGRMVLEPVYSDQGNPYYVARTTIDVLVLLDPPGSDPGPEPGASSDGGGGGSRTRVREYGAAGFYMRSRS